MNKKGEFTVQGMLISVLIVGLVMGVFGAIIASMGGYYDTTGYDEEAINELNKVQNLSETLQEVNEDVDSVTIESSWFDFFSGIWSKMLAPFKFIYRTFAYLIEIFNQFTEVFQLLPIFREFFSAVILVLVIVGVVLIKFSLGRKK